MKLPLKKKVLLGKEEYTLYEYEQIIILSPIIVRGFQRLGQLKSLHLFLFYRIKYTTN